MPVPLGAVSDLLDPVFEEVADELAEPQRRALAGALGIETADAARPTGSRCCVRSSPRSARSRADAPAAPRDRRRPVARSARPRACSRSRCVASATSRSASSRPCEVTPRRRIRSALQTRSSPVRLRSSPSGRSASGTSSSFCASGSTCGSHGRRSPPSTPPRDGNPMFALEFARAVEREPADLQAQLPVPSSLQELVGERVRRTSARHAAVARARVGDRASDSGVAREGARRRSRRVARGRSRRGRGDRSRHRRRRTLHAPAARSGRVLRDAARPPPRGAPAGGRARGRPRAGSAAPRACDVDARRGDRSRRGTSGRGRGRARSARRRGDTRGRGRTSHAS